MTYFLIFCIAFVALAIINHFIKQAENFEDSGYDPHCFECNQGSCGGCKYNGPVSPRMAEGGYFFNDAGDIIGVYVKEGDNPVDYNSEAM